MSIDILRCSKCKKAKPVSEFHKNACNKYGYSNYCKKCHNVSRRKSYEKLKKLSLLLPKKPLTEDQRIGRNESMRKWRLRNKTRVMAHQTVAIALRAGRVNRPNKCSLCETTCKPEAHHWHGYAPNKWLDFIWLCKTCHAGHDKIIRRMKQWPDVD